MMLPSPLFWRPLGELYETVRTGRPAFDRVHGQRCFEHFAEHPDEAAMLKAAFTDPPDVIASIARGYDFSRFGRIVDVGGGEGALLAEILSLNPDLQGILFDLPSVVANNVTRHGMELLGGDFFEAVPPGADAYVLRGVIHDWSDEDAIRILKNCRRAMRADGTLLVVERVIESNKSAGSLTDLLVMVIGPDRECTYVEFEALLRESGFALVRVIRTDAGPSIIEGRPVIGPDQTIN
jgi:SAM-dependent methyltransferase